MIETQWRYLNKEFQVQDNYKADEITMKFDDRVLLILLPKLIRRVEPSAVGGGGARSISEENFPTHKGCPMSYWIYPCVSERSVKAFPHLMRFPRANKVLRGGRKTT